MKEGELPKELEEGKENEDGLLPKESEEGKLEISEPCDPEMTEEKAMENPWLEEEPELQPSPQGPVLHCPSQQSTMRMGAPLPPICMLHRSPCVLLPCEPPEDVDPSLPLLP